MPTFSLQLATELMSDAGHNHPLPAITALISSHNDRRAATTLLRQSFSAPPTLPPTPPPRPTTPPLSAALAPIDPYAPGRIAFLCRVSQGVALLALQLCDGDEVAAEALLTGPQGPDTAAALAEEEVRGLAAAFPPTSPPSVPPATGQRRVQGEVRDFLKFSDDEEGLIAAVLPHNVCVQLLSFLRQQLRVITSRCALCGGPVVYEGMALTTCDSASCKLSYDAQGVDIDLSQHIRDAPDVTDLLLSLLFSAALTRSMVSAGPLQVKARHPTANVELNFLAPQGGLDYAALLDTLDRMPRVAQLVEWAVDSVFVENVNAVDLLIIPLLRWLFHSTPTHLRHLSAGEGGPGWLGGPRFAVVAWAPQRSVDWEQRRRRVAVQQTSWQGFLLCPAADAHTWLRAGLPADELVSLYCDAQECVRAAQAERQTGWGNSALATHLCCILECEVIGAQGTGSGRQWAAADAVRVDRLHVVTEKTGMNWPADSWGTPVTTLHQVPVTHSPLDTSMSSHLTHTPPYAAGPWLRASVARMTLPCPMEGAFLSVAAGGGMLVMATTTNHIFRWDVEAHWCRTVRLEGHGFGRVHRVFVEPYGHHSVVSMDDGTVYYLHAVWWETPQRVPQLQGNVIESVAWSEEEGEDASTTHRILLGTSKGCILEVQLDEGKDGEQQYVRQVHRLSNPQAADEEAADVSVSGLFMAALKSKSSAAPSFLVIALTSSRQYQYIGGPTLEDVFSSPAHVSTHIKLPSGSGSSELRSDGRSRGTGCHGERTAAWTTGAGIYHGELVLGKGQGQGKRKGLVKGRTLAYPRNKALGQDLRSPLSTLLVKSHFLLLTRFRLVALHRETGAMAWERHFDRSSGKMLGLAFDAAQGAQWLFTTTSVYRINVEVEDKVAAAPYNSGPLVQSGLAGLLAARAQQRHDTGSSLTAERDLFARTALTVAAVTEGKEEEEEEEEEGVVEGTRADSDSVDTLLLAAASVDSISNDSNTGLRHWGEAVGDSGESAEDRGEEVEEKKEERWPRWDAGGMRRRGLSARATRMHRAGQESVGDSTAPPVVEPSNGWTYFDPDTGREW